MILRKIEEDTLHLSEHEKAALAQKLLHEA